jgi:hypothetical protein
MDLSFPAEMDDLDGVLDDATPGDGHEGVDALQDYKASNGVEAAEDPTAVTDRPALDGEAAPSAEGEMEVDEASGSEEKANGGVENDAEEAERDGPQDGQVEAEDAPEDGEDEQPGVSQMLVSQSRRRTVGGLELIAESPMSIQPLRPHSTHAPPPTAAAIRALLKLEVKFAALRDRLYLERTQEAAAEEEMLAEGEC